MGQIVLGTTALTEQPRHYGWSPGRGAWAVRTFEAAGERGKQNILGKAASLELGAVEYEVIENFGKHRLTATFGGTVDGRNEVPVSVWEVRVNRVAKDFFQAPNVYELHNYKFVNGSSFFDRSSSDSALDLLKRCVEARKLKEAQEDYNIAFTVSADAIIKIFIEAYSLALSGVHDFIVEQEVVVHTQTVSSQYARSIASSNGGNILTMQQMIALEGAPETAVETIALPANLLAPSPPDFPYGFMYGYRKDRPEMHQTAYNKWQMISQYEQGFWSTLLYTAAS